ncbi:MAG: phosphoribosyltransferase [Actinomycetota bacterium]
MSQALQERSFVNPLVLGLPRGGVPVAFEVALGLEAQLDIMVVRKLGVPGHEELAMGAVASGDVRILNEAVIASMRISSEAINKAIVTEQIEVDRREKDLRAGRFPVPISGKEVIIVDDGLATGASMKAAIVAARIGNCKSVHVAVPVGAASTCVQVRSLCESLSCLHQPQDLLAVGAWYDDFSPTTDDDVRRLLREAAGGDHA